MPVEGQTSGVLRALVFGIREPLIDRAQAIENKGFIICPVDMDERGFSGNSGVVNGRPYIAVNTTMPAERQRFTLIHELAHLVFIFGDGEDEEKAVDGIAGAFLLPVGHQT